MESIRKQMQSGSPPCFSLQSLDVFVFNGTSAHLHASWAFSFFCYMRYFRLMHHLCLCLSLMYYKQAVSDFICTPCSSFIFHACCLFYSPFISPHSSIFPKLLVLFFFFFQSGEELMKHTQSQLLTVKMRAASHTHSCRKTHILILDCDFHFSI